MSLPSSQAGQGELGFTHCTFFHSMLWNGTQLKPEALAKVCMHDAVACNSTGPVSPKLQCLRALVAMTDLWQLLEQSFLFDRRNASDNGDCPDTTNLTNTLQMFTHLHTHRKCILIPAIACSDAYSPCCTSLAALHLSANQCQIVEQNITLWAPTAIDIEPLCLSSEFCSMHAASTRFAQHLLSVLYTLQNTSSAPTTSGTCIVLHMLQYTPTCQSGRFSTER